ncbi:unnamed protein product [Moneuplotes crassus]|uniref:Uncharacterized protein n=1 Tax=Euplotes crassus TaxID=5936 RepID=A0AAD2D8X3_EUPCR|nr:unnamed protein product [Moneuplotes crassus]
MSYKQALKDESKDRNRNYKNDIEMFSRAGKLTVNQYMVFSPPKASEHAEECSQDQSPSSIEPSQGIIQFSEDPMQTTKPIIHNSTLPKKFKRRRKRRDKSQCDAVFKSISRERRNQILDPKLEKHNFSSYRVIDKIVNQKVEIPHRPQNRVVRIGSPKDPLCDKLIKVLQIGKPETDFSNMIFNHRKASNSIKNDKKNLNGCLKSDKHINSSIEDNLVRKGFNASSDRSETTHIISTCKHRRNKDTLTKRAHLNHSFKQPNVNNKCKLNILSQDEKLATFAKTSNNRSAKRAMVNFSANKSALPPNLRREILSNSESPEKENFSYNNKILNDTYHLIKSERSNGMGRHQIVATNQHCQVPKAKVYIDFSKNKGRGTSFGNPITANQKYVLSP